MSAEEEFRQLQTRIIGLQRDIKRMDLEISKVSMIDAPEIIRELQAKYIRRLEEISMNIDKLNDKYDEALEYGQYYKEKKTALPLSKNNN